MVGSGIVWPDLDARRIDAVTPSVGYVPERIKNIGGFGARGSEVACRVPVSSRDVHRAACRAKSVCYLLSVVEIVVETNHVATADVTERPQLADFDE